MPRRANSNTESQATIRIEYYRSFIHAPKTHKTIVRSLGLRKLHQVVERFYLGGKLLGGFTLLDPDPIGAGSPGGGNFGVALSLEYATNMDHFSVGLDISYRLIIGPNINALMFYPRVQYTF